MGRGATWHGAARRAGRRTLTVTSAVLRFALGSLAAVAVVAVGGFVALRRAALEEARRDSRNRVPAPGEPIDAQIDAEATPRWRRRGEVGRPPGAPSNAEAWVRAARRPPADPIEAALVAEAAVAPAALASRTPLRPPPS
jgi:hypothetical protein